jgi:hypothetical protein
MWQFQYYQGLPLAHNVENLPGIVMVPVKNIGTDHVDYFQGDHASRLGLTEGCFGIRVWPSPISAMDSFSTLGTFIHSSAN